MTSQPCYLAADKGLFVDDVAVSELGVMQVTELLT